MTAARAPRVGRDAAATLAFSASFVLVLCLPAILRDGDTLWQIRTGEWILDRHAIPATDPFSATAGQLPWAAHEWLAETLMALAWRLGGMAGIMVLAAAAAGLTAAVLLRHTRRFLPGIFGILALALALSNVAASLLARPHMLAWPCLALWCCGLAAARADRVAPSPWLLPVMLVWVNLHGSFIVGLLLAGALLIEALFDPGADRRRVLTGWGGFVAGACLTALLNPNFAAGVLFPFHMVQMRSLAWIKEWQPTDFGRPQPLELMLLGAVALGFSGKVRLPPMRSLLLLVLLHADLSASRNGPLLGLIGIAILAEPFGLAVGRGAAQALGGVWRGIAIGTMVAAAGAAAVRLTLPLDPSLTGSAFAAAVERVPAALRARPVLNDYSLGGNLIFHGERPFIDSRADLYGDAFLARYRAIVAPDHAALTRALSDYGIAWTIFPAHEPVVAMLDREAGWRRLVEADGLVIHVRDGGADPGTIPRYPTAGPLTGR